MGCGDTLRVWDGNAIKFGCHDYCTTIHVIKFIEKKKKKESAWKLQGPCSVSENKTKQNKTKQNKNTLLWRSHCGSASWRPLNS